jgi:hypothetical protein
MQPFGDEASISEAKLTDYILSPTHRIGANRLSLKRLSAYPSWARKDELD